MMLAPTLAGDGPRTRTAQRVRARSLAIDFSVLAVCVAIAAALFLQGGLEALAGAAIGALLGARGAYWRNARLAGAVSGAFAGLFAGALFAGFFHGALVAAFTAF